MDSCDPKKEIIVSRLELHFVLSPAPAPQISHLHTDLYH